MCWPRGVLSGGIQKNTEAKHTRGSCSVSRRMVKSNYEKGTTKGVKRGRPNPKPPPLVTFIKALAFPFLGSQLGVGCRGPLKRGGCMDHGRIQGGNKEDTVFQKKGQWDRNAENARVFNPRELVGLGNQLL